jgi:hypothetical protein
MFYQGVRIDQTNERPRVDLRMRLYSLAGSIRKEARPSSSHVNGRLQSFHPI